MINEIQIFNSPQFGQIRTAGTQDAPLFCLADVCKVLALDSSQVIKRLDDWVVTIHPIQDALGRTRQANFVNEDGLYDVILDSRKPEAKAFRKWITSEVLPSIRKTGSYGVPRTFSEALMLAANQAKQIEEQQKTITANSKEILALGGTIAEMLPKVSYYDRILASKGTMTVTQVAQDYGMSAKKFNAMLSRLGLQHKVNGQWILYAKHLKQGYVHSKTVDIVRHDGMHDVKFCTEWTQKGRLFLYEELKKHDVLPLIEKNSGNIQS